MNVQDIMAHKDMIEEIRNTKHGVKSKLSLSLAPDLIRFVEKIAGEAGVPKSTVVEYALRKYFNV